MRGTLLLRFMVGLLILAMGSPGCGRETGGPALSTLSSPDAGVASKVPPTPQSDDSVQPQKVGRVFLRVSKCGYYPTGKAERFGTTVRLVVGSGNAVQGMDVPPQIPGSWWCLMGGLELEGEEAPEGPLLTQGSPLKAKTNIPGVQWLAEEKRREVAVPEKGPFPPPACVACVHPMFVPNIEYKNALNTIVDDLFTTDPAALRDACKRARELEGDPESARAEALARQKAYLETGEQIGQGGGLLATFEVVRAKCERAP